LVIEKKMLNIAKELRCLVCQNQTIADSDAGLAVDLRREIRNMLKAGQDEKEILDFMTARYGDFVRYRPPLNAGTVLLWFGPAILLLLGLSILFIHLRKRQTQPVIESRKGLSEEELARARKLLTDDDEEKGA